MNGLENSFITLTYNDQNLPSDNSLNKAHWQKFMKRLRKKFAEKKIRFFMCGEYGEDQDALKVGKKKLGRPHYHACLFGFGFADRTQHTVRNGIPVYRSAVLESLWEKGYSEIGEVNFKTAAYVARYITKKISGAKAFEHYLDINYATGTFTEKLPEFTLQSNRPGIGKKWYEKYRDDVFPHDNIIHDGRKIKVPRYYDKLAEREGDISIPELKRARVTRARRHQVDQTPARLRDREIVKTAQTKNLKRKLA